MAFTIPKPNLLIPKVPSIAVVGLLAAQFRGFVYLENGKKLAVEGDSGKFVAAGCLIGAQ